MGITCENSKPCSFHCPCICRIGGRNNFYHCERCDMCLAVSIKDSHKVTFTGFNRIVGIFWELHGHYSGPLHCHWVESKNIHYLSMVPPYAGNGCSQFCKIKCWTIQLEECFLAVSGYHIKSHTLKLSSVSSDSQRNSDVFRQFSFKVFGRGEDGTFWTATFAYTLPTPTLQIFLNSAPTLWVYFLSTPHWSPPVLGFGRRSHKQPSSCPLYGCLIKPLVCSRDVKLYPINQPPLTWHFEWSSSYQYQIKRFDIQYRFHHNFHSIVSPPHRTLWLCTLPGHSYFYITSSLANWLLHIQWVLYDWNWDICGFSCSVWRRHLVLTVQCAWKIYILLFCLLIFPHVVTYFTCELHSYCNVASIQ